MNRVSSGVVSIASLALAGAIAFPGAQASAAEAPASNDVWGGHHPVSVTRTSSPADHKYVGKSPMDVAPTCIIVTNQDLGAASSTIYLINDCGSVQRVRIIMTRGGDSDCNTMGIHAGWQFESYGLFPKLDHIENC